MTQKNLLHYSVQGTGSPAILIHGLAASRYDWDALIPRLTLHSYCTYAVDLLGHGDSPKPIDPQMYTVKTLYATLEDWIEHLDICHPLVLIGHSLGGLMSLHYALRHPGEIKAMVLIDPLYTFQQLSPVVRLLSRSPLARSSFHRSIPLELVNILLGWDPIPTAQFSEQVRKRIALDYKRASPHIFHIVQDLVEMTPNLKYLDIPVLVIWGEKDLTLDPSSFPSLVSALCQATGVSMPGSGHHPHIGEPERVNQLILDFLAANLVEKRIAVQ
ncbi:MAG: alpha/beta hydrolase [Anaerolineales bacterium]|nr:alpha/beta hydrolase [Anaerolineales bacterium]